MSHAGASKKKNTSKPKSAPNLPSSSPVSSPLVGLSLTASALHAGSEPDPEPDDDPDLQLPGSAGPSGSPALSVPIDLVVKPEEEENSNSKWDRRSTRGPTELIISEKEIKKEDIEKCEKAYAHFMQALDDKHMSLMVNVPYPDAAGIWKKLLDKYERNTDANKIHLREMLLTIKMKHGESADSYISRVEKLGIQLAGLGTNISDAELVYALKKGLPKQEYSSLLDYYTYSDKNNEITFDDVAKHIRDKYEKMQLEAGEQEKTKSNTHSDTHEQAHYAQSNRGTGSGRGGFGSYRGRARGGFNNGRGRGGRGGFAIGGNNDGDENGDHEGNKSQPNSKFPGKCFLCGKTGHKQDDCYSTKTCSKCKRKGHIAKVCYNKEKNSEKNNNKNSGDDGNASDESDYGFSSIDDRGTSSEISDDCFLADSGCTRTISKNKNLFTSLRTSPTTIGVEVANKEMIYSNIIGDIKVPGTKITLRDVVYLPEASHNLLSISRILDKYYILFGDKQAIITTKRNGGKEIMRIPQVGKLFVWNIKEKAERDVAMLSKEMIWHQRLGHLSWSGMNKLVTKKAIEGMEELDMNKAKEELMKCESCIMGKMHRVRFEDHMHEADKAEDIMDRWHADLWGPMIDKDKNEIESLGGNRYGLRVVDEKSRKKFLIGLKTKDEACQKLIELHKEKVIETGKPLKEFHSDGGGEFSSQILLKYFKANGVRVTKSTKNTPQNNSIPERAHRTNGEGMLAALYTSGLPLSFWLEAATAKVYVENKCISAENPTKTPDEIWTGKVPSVKRIRVWGCDCYVHVQKEERTKLEMKARKGILVGYSESQSAYRIFMLDNRKIEVSRDIKCIEESFSFANELKAEAKMKGENLLDIDNIEAMQMKNEIELVKRISLEEIKAEEKNGLQPIKAESKEEEKNGLQPLKTESKVEERNGLEPIDKAEEKLKRKSSRKKKNVNRYGMVDYENEVAFSAIMRELGLSAEQVGDEPKAFSEAIECIEGKEWRKAMDEEIQSLKENNTWKLVKLPNGKKAMKCKWVFKKKINSQGKVVRFKARLCAKGYTQQEGVDYFETFAPVMKYKSMRIILAIVAKLDYEFKQLDVLTAFLNALMKEEVYMEQPEGYEEGTKDMVCRLIKTIYGTKQAPREWNKEVNEFIVNELQLNRCTSDSCVYVKKSRTGKVIIVAIFVDDFTAAYDSTDEGEWNQMKQKLMSKYKMKDLGDVEWILGMKVVRDRSRRIIKLDQEVYVEKILEKFNMERSKEVDTPSVPGIKYSKQDAPTTEKEKEEMREKPYRELVGSLLYAAISTRPDIAHAVNTISRHMSNPGEKLWIAGKRILRYLRGTSKLGLVFNGKNEKAIPTDKNKLSSDIVVYVDSDWSGDTDERKSTTGFYVFIYGCVVNWWSKKQTTVSLSSAEAEYMAICAATQEVKWVRIFMKEVLMNEELESTIMFSDSQSAIDISKNDVHHGRTKHIDIRHHFIRQEINNGEIKLEWIATHYQLADMLTKALGVKVFLNLRNQIME